MLLIIEERAVGLPGKANILNAVSTQLPLGGAFFDWMHLPLAEPDPKKWRPVFQKLKQIDEIMMRFS